MLSRESLGRKTCLQPRPIYNFKASECAERGQEQQLPFSVVQYTEAAYIPKYVPDVS